MDCTEVREDRMDVLYGEADAETSARFEAHRSQFQSFHTRPFADPFLPVALRKSTTSCAFSASAA